MPSVNEESFIYITNELGTPSQSQKKIGYRKHSSIISPDLNNKFLADKRSSIHSNTASNLKILHKRSETKDGDRSLQKTKS